jgi:hypothetical protein
MFFTQPTYALGGLITLMRVYVCAATKSMGEGVQIV